MTIEAVVYALLLGLVAGALTQFILTGRLWVAQGGAAPALTVPVQLMVSLGAGIYEELLFRVLLVAGLDALAVRVFGWKPLGAGVFAAVLGALIFSAFHYVGPFGDPWQLGSFTFRAVAGLLFSGLYLLRGFGITAWSHALYDVFLTLGS
ncbi:MAG TPA: CPBP family glutamic-type intramembrane protease, partial [Gemmatimonadales bacterium]